MSLKRFPNKQWRYFQGERDELTREKVEMMEFRRGAQFECCEWHTKNFNLDRQYACRMAHESGSAALES